MITKSSPSTSIGAQPALVLPSNDLASKAVHDSAAAAKASSDADAQSSRAGLALLFAASQVEKKPGDDSEANAEEDKTVEALSTVTDGSKNGGVAKGKAENNAPSAEEDISDDEAAVKQELKDLKVKTFPQILHEILETPEFQPIAHWLPDGRSFIIADKKRFSEEILPRYFRRVALFHSFIRKLNRYGFRKVKGSTKGEESSFAHNHFVREKPWLCLKMNCKSKPSYHKVPTAKKKTQQAAAIEAAHSVSNSTQLGMPMQMAPSLMAADGIGMMGTNVSRGFLPTTATHLSPLSSLPTTTAIGPNSNSAAIAAIQERYLASVPMLPEHPQQRLLRERQMLMLQMRQHQQRQAQFQRLHEMSMAQAQNDEKAFNSYDNFIHNSVMAENRRDLMRRNVFY